MILAVLAALLVSPAASPTPAATPVAEHPAIVVNGQRKHWDPNRKVCREIAQPGSRLSVERICRTALEWEAEKQENKQLLQQKQYNGAQ